jgi:hypothetical protein
MNEREMEDLLAALRMADEYRVATVRHLQTEFAGIQASLHLVRIWLRALQADVDGVAEHLGLIRRRYERTAIRSADRVITR